jgi:Fe-Mn family superoxide dismutase
MAIELPPLPWAEDALESKGLSKETIEYHYGKHHATYVNTLNGLIEGTDHADADLETIIRDAEINKPLFNNAAQVWNHTFYWNCLSPSGGGQPDGEVGDAINSAFGSYDAFASEFTEAAKTQFGSGWAWLVDDGGLKIMKTPNADLPLKHGVKALLTIDVWEHAYYIDWRNARPDYISNFLANLVNWEFVGQNLSS